MITDILYDKNDNVVIKFDDYYYLLRNGFCHIETKDIKQFAIIGKMLAVLSNSNKLTIYNVDTAEICASNNNVNNIYYSINGSYLTVDMFDKFDIISLKGSQIISEKPMIYFIIWTEFTFDENGFLIRSYDPNRSPLNQEIEIIRINHHCFVPYGNNMMVIDMSLNNKYEFYNDIPEDFINNYYDANEINRDDNGGFYLKFNHSNIDKLTDFISELDKLDIWSSFTDENMSNIKLGSEKYNTLIKSDSESGYLEIKYPTSTGICIISHTKYYYYPNISLINGDSIKIITLKDLIINEFHFTFNLINTEIVYHTHNNKYIDIIPIDIIASESYLQQGLTIIPALIRGNSKYEFSVNLVDDNMSPIAYGEAVTKQFMSQLADQIILNIDNIDLKKAAICLHTIIFMYGIRIPNIHPYFIKLIFNEYFTHDIHYHILLKKIKSDYDYYVSQFTKINDSMNINNFQEYVDYLLCSTLTDKQIINYIQLAIGFVRISDRNLSSLTLLDIIIGPTKHNFKFSFDNSIVEHKKCFMKCFEKLSQEEQDRIVTNICGYVNTDSNIIVIFEPRIDPGLRRIEYDDDLEMDEDVESNEIPEGNLMNNYEIRACSSTITIHLFPNEENLTSMFNVLSVIDNYFKDR